MSKIQFIHSPFPDNHDGFDYAPKSFMDIQHDEQAQEQSVKENKLLSMLTSIFK